VTQELASFCTDQTTYCANAQDDSLEHGLLLRALRYRMASHMHALHRVAFATPALTTVLSA
jgi:hypothetical protein